MYKVNITTFPRSGRTFLLNLIQSCDQSKKIYINAYHFVDWIYKDIDDQVLIIQTNEFKDLTKVYFNTKENNIGILRNPLDSILSTYAMTTFFAFKNSVNKRILDGYDKDESINIVKNELMLNFNVNISDIIKYYIKYYEFYLINYKNILLLKFEDIINDTEKCLLQISKTFSINMDINNFYKNKIILKNTDNFLVSSKENEWYSYAKENINHYELIKKANELYNELLNKITKL